MGSGIFLGAALVALSQPVVADDAAPLVERVATTLRATGPGTRFGLVVTTEDGQDIVAIAPDDRFVPASNTKIFTTAAIFEAFDMTTPDQAGGATVRVEPNRDGPPNVILSGNGDARLSSAPDCTTDCLAILADAVAAASRNVADVVGDDTAFPDERWSPGMSWNNIPTRSGTGISALTIDDNELVLRVTPATAVGAAASLESPGYYAVDNRVVTVGTGRTDLRYDRMPGSMAVRLEGTIALGAAPETLRLGIDDPAQYAAFRLKTLLEARGVRVLGKTVARHRPLAPVVASAREATPPAMPRPDAPLPTHHARLVPPPLGEDMTVVNKMSQNVHAELALRRLGRVSGSGSIADGQRAVQAMLGRAGVPRWAYDFSDGSGMSTYNRVTPRATVKFLQWVSRQPWGAAWRATLPIGGVDGTTRRRFVGTPLAGKLFAKTGTLHQAAALSGYMIGASGRTLVFASFAADMPADSSVSAAVDAALAIVAAEN